MSLGVREQLNADIKSAMKARDRERLTLLRTVSAAIKQREVDERITLTDADVIALIDKQIKQRKDAATQYRQGQREDLASAEEREIEMLSGYLPQPLSEDEIQALINAAMEQTGAQGMPDMGKVMAVLKPQLTGRADLGQVSAKVRAHLQG
jgi:uncharacterized protein YqeY